MHRSNSMAPVRQFLPDDQGRTLRSRGTVSTRATLFSMMALLSLAACQTGRFGRLRINCPSRNAALFVDGKYLGALKVLEDADIRLPEGWHQVEVRQRGFYPRYKRVRIRNGRLTVLAVSLVTKLDWAMSRSRSAHSSKKPVGPRASAPSAKGKAILSTDRNTRP